MWNKLLIFVACVLIYFYKKSNSNREGNRLQFYYKYTLYFLSYFVTALVIWPVFLLKPRSVHNVRTIVPVARLVSWLMDVKWDIRNREVLALNRGAVIVANHQSALDALGLFHVWDVAYKVVSISKKELFYILPLGLACYLSGTVFIDRNKPREAYKKLFGLINTMTEKKTKVLIFPEGTRHSSPEILPFKKGAFKLAVAAQVPIIPVVFSPYYFIDLEKRVFDKGTGIMQCLDEVPTAGLTEADVPALIEYVHNKMSTVYKQLRKEVYSNYGNL